MTSSFAPSGDSAPPPIGVHFVHQYYPGFIDVRPHSLYLIDGGGLRGGVHVLRHVRPLVVTDFANELIRVHADDGAVHTRLARPISDIDQASNAIDAKGLEGRSAPTLAIEKGADGRIFYQDVFTELQTLTEIAAHDSSAGRRHAVAACHHRYALATIERLLDDPQLLRRAPVTATTAVCDDLGHGHKPMLRG